jgi:GT2 family glycosyltransferase
MASVNISIFIATRNRPQSVYNCLISLLQNTYRDCEILIADQSIDGETEKIVKNLQSEKIKYFRIQNGGKSRALNFLIKKSKSKIIAFTDDDCVVDKYWIQNIALSFKNNAHVIGVFGKTLPYRPNKNLNLVCPCTFENKEIRFISKPEIHYKTIGYGNNMAFRKELFDKNGTFKEWLGPGSIGDTAEDAEFTLRALVYGHTLMYNPKVLIRHNKWLSEREMRTQELSYAYGEMACYGYFSHQGYTFAHGVLKKHMVRTICLCMKYATSLLCFSWNRKTFGSLYWSMLNLTTQIRGLSIGTYFAIIDPLKKSFSEVRNK